MSLWEFEFFYFHPHAAIHPSQSSLWYPNLSLNTAFTHLHMSRFFNLFLLFLATLSILPAQGPSRSGVPAELEDKRFQRRFPCGGQEVFEQDFQADTLPDSWLVLDEDGFTPRTVIQNLTPVGGWQLVTDFKDEDSLNMVVASPSWYNDDLAPSDDYLVLEQVTLPSNPCLSWYAYSQDQLFPESYEIRISTTTPDAAGFLANPAVITIDAEGDEYTFRSTSLAQYGEETVYIAFRHTTDNGFILALDDIRLAQVQQRDIAMFNVDALTLDPVDTVNFSGAVINRGLDTLVFDSLQMEISWQINNDPIQTIAIADSFSILPNDTLQFVHDSTWVPPVSAAYRLRVWVSGVAMDGNIENDTLSRFQAVGNATSIFEELSDQLTIFPNPSSGAFSVELGTTFHHEARYSIMSLTGQVISSDIIRNNKAEIMLANIPQGMYLLVVEDIKQKRATQRLLIE